MKRIAFNNKFARLAFFAFLWTAPTVLVCILVFSVYPNYLLRGNYGKAFVQLRQISDSIVQKLIPQKTENVSSMTLDSTIIEPRFDGGIPQRVTQPLIATIVPDDAQTRAYFSKPTKPILFGPAMIPDPHTTYAPLPGKIAGFSSHNHQQFRYPVDLEKKKENEFRIFITGGSVAWGSAATDTEFTIAGFMEKELRKRYPGFDIKVITAAAGGWVSTQERIWVLNRITEYEPDIIISYSGFNDLHSYGLKEDLFDRYALEGDYFRHAIQMYDQYNRGEAISMLGAEDEGSRFQPFDYPRKALKNARIINSYLKMINVKYVYVQQPVAQKKEPPIYYELYKKLGSEMAKQAKSDGYQYIDHSGIFDSKPEFFIDMCHPGDRGFEVIAKDLLAKIIIKPGKLRNVSDQ